jgi:hypothetical protein
LSKWSLIIMMQKNIRVNRIVQSKPRVTARWWNL